MKIKMLKEHKIGDASFEVGEVIESSNEKTCKDLITKGIAEEFKDVEVKEEVKSAPEVEQKETKIMNIEVGEKKISPDTLIVKSMDYVKAIATGQFRQAEEIKASAGANISTAGDGGLLVDPTIVQEIYNNAMETSVLFPKVAKQPIGANSSSMKLRRLNDTNNIGTDYQGVELEVIAEGNAYTPGKLPYSTVTIAVNKLGAVFAASDEILEDVPGYMNYVSGLVGQAFGLKLDQEILLGTDSLFTALVDSTGNVDVNVTGTGPTRAQIAKMYMANINPGMAEWYMSGAAYELLMNLDDDGNNSLLVPNYAVSPFGTILGRPVNIVPAAPAMNANGSILFMNPAQAYIVGTKGGSKHSMSAHLYFLTDDMAYKWVIRCAGAPTRNVTAALADGRKVSHVVQSEAI
jgi:HK97 family phage major capsid protein